MKSSTRIELWPHGAPVKSNFADAEFANGIAPFFDLYLPENLGEKTAAVVICPGGGYGDLCTSYEGDEIAEWLCERGIAGLVLHYRHAPHFAFPAPQLDAQRALRIARANAEKWNLRADKIGILGFSAGGHLAATCATLFDCDEFRISENSEFEYSKLAASTNENANFIQENSANANSENRNVPSSNAENIGFADLKSANVNLLNLNENTNQRNLNFEYSNDATRAISSRPDFAVLCYPVISMSKDYAHSGSRNNLIGVEFDEKLAHFLSSERQVTPQTPPTFLFHTSDDDVVPARHSLDFYAALRENGVAAELHTYQHGPHGVGFAQADPILGTWPKLLEMWLKTQISSTR